MGLQYLLPTQLPTPSSCQESWPTVCTLMDGNRFWNMVAMSLMCMP